MKQTQPISPASKKQNIVLSALLFLVAIFFLSLPIHTYLTQGYSALGGSGWIFVFLGLSSASVAIHLYTLKKEMTVEAIEEKKQKEDKELETLNKWYIRYPSSILLIAIALISYVSYTKGIIMHGKAILLFNPITGTLAAIIAIINTRELTIAAIAIAILYYTYLGIAALPVSVAIIIGSIIIAYAVNK